MTRLKKLSSLQTDDEMQGFEAQLKNSLKISIETISIEGFAENYEGNLKITMNNGDIITWEYKIDPSGDATEKSDISINGETFSTAGSSNPPQDDIRTAYLRYLKFV